LAEATAIQAVIDVYNRATQGSYVITRQPDQGNRGSPEIDAYAESEGLRPLAIEHTTIESVKLQRRDSAWFMHALGSLQTELGSVFPFQLAIGFPYRNAEAGQDWPTIRERIKSWLLANALAAPFGRTTHEVPGVPFVLTLSKRTDQPHQTGLVRTEPPGEGEALLLENMHDALDHKYLKLGDYRAKGAVAVLVLESDDIALANPQRLYEAFLRSLRQQPRPNLDQVWLVFRGCPYSFLGPADVMAAVNPANFRFGPQFAEEWLSKDR
jgi:hypothetical protein